MSAMHSILWIDNWGDLAGGGQHSLFEIVTRLDRNVFRPVVACGAEGSLSESLRRCGIPVFVIPLPSLKGEASSVSKAAAGLKELIEKEDIKIIHANSTRSALYALSASKSLNKPVIYHARVLRDRWADFFLDRYLSRNCKLIIANSNEVAKRFPKRRGVAKVQVIYNGIDISAFDKTDRQNSRKAYGLDSESAAVGIISMLEPRKGHGVLLDAFRIVRANVPSARLLIAGSEPPGAGGWRQVLENSIRSYGLSDSVRLIGEVHDVASFMCAIDVFAFPVIKPEGFGRVVIEAYAARRAVVASNLGALKEIIENGISGFLLPPGKINALADAIIELLGDGALRARLGEAGRRRAEAEFNIDRLVDKVSACYRELLL